MESGELWHKRFWNLRVTDVTERAKQIRVIATAGDSSEAWYLRHASRE